MADGSCYGRLGSRLKRRWFSRNNHRVMSFAGEFIGFSVVKLRSCWIELEDSAIQMFERHTSDKLDIFGGAHFVWAPGVADSFRCCPFCGMILPWFCRRKRWSSWAIATSSDETLGLQWQKSPDWALQKPKTLRHCMWVVGFLSAGYLLWTTRFCVFFGPHGWIPKAEWQLDLGFRGRM